MLAVEGDDEQWCAVCAAVDGAVELRVGEPPRRGLRRRRDPAGEAWLRDHGYFQVIDAWTFPVPAETGDTQCAVTLEAALAGALGADTTTPLRHVLTHPGLVPGAGVPPPDAPFDEHLAAAFRGLAEVRQGRFHIDSGRPASLRAWVGVAGDELLVEREVPGVAESPGESWREPLTPEGADAAAAELARRERADRPSTASEPWLLGYIPNGNGAG